MTGSSAVSGLVTVLLAVLLPVCQVSEARAADQAVDTYQAGSYQALQAKSGTDTPDDHGGEFGTKMVNSVPVPEGVYQDVVRITFRPSALSNAQAVCTGTMVHGQHAVLTAGHCSCGVADSYRFVTKETFDDHLDTKQLASFTLRAIREAVRFPGFDCTEGADNAGRDLALFFVRNLNEEKNEPPPSKAGPLTRVASMHSVYAAGARQLTASGYGITQNGTFPDTLERGRIDVGSYFCSQGDFGGTPCAGFREFVLGTLGAGSVASPVDTCNGDSGGPVYWYPPAQTDALTGKVFFPPPALVGVTSRALVFADHLPGMLCGGGGVYTAVGHSDVLNWMLSSGVLVRTIDLSIDLTGTGGH